MTVGALPGLIAAVVAAAACCCCTTHAFQSDLGSCLSHRSAASRVTSSSSSSATFAKKKKDNNKEEPKYSIIDKSYGISSSPSSSNEQTIEEMQSSMSNFFNAYTEWHPLFRNVMCSSTPNLPASSFLSGTQQYSEEELWGISTLEKRNPWRLLPSKPTSDSSLQTLSTFLDEWQQSLLDIPLDSIITGDNDLHFLEEGRRTIAVTRFHVLDEYNNNNNLQVGENSQHYDWENELFRICWSELAHLMSQDDNDTGSLVLLPDNILDEQGEGRGLEYVREFVEHNLIRPIQWLGREEDWEIVAMERGSLAVRLLYKLSDIPDLSERDSRGDEDVKL